MTASLLALLALSAPLEVLYHADLEGQMAVPQCGKPGQAPPDYAALVGAIVKAREAAGANAPIVLLGGDNVSPDLFARGILKRDKEAGARDLAAALKRAGYDAIAIGNHDLSLDRDRFDRFAAAVAALGMPLVATNLKCDAQKQQFCQHVRPEVIVERGGAKVAILATLSPRVLPSIRAKDLEGISLDEPLGAVRDSIKRLRGQGVEAFLLMTQVKSGEQGYNEMYELQQELARGDAPDVILSSGLADEVGGTTRLLRQDGAPALIGSTTGSASVSHVTIKPHGAPGPRVDAVGLAATTEGADAEAAKLLAPHIQSYCERYGAAVGPGTVADRISKDEFVDYVLEVMRHSTGAEVALVNRGLVKAKPFPLAGTLTKAELLRAIPHHASLGLVKMMGGELEAKLTPAFGHPKLASAGLSIPKAGKLQVNGRAIDAARAYKVVTIDYVAEGGDAIFAPGVLAFEALEGAPDLRDVVEKWLETKTAAEDNDPSISAKSDFGAPTSDRLLTVGIADFAIDFTNTSISNTATPYTDAQLARAEQRAIKLESTGILQFKHPINELDNRLNLKYGYARNVEAGKPAVEAENLDLITFTSLYNFRGLKDVKALPSIAIPDPYARLFFESEFTKPDLVVDPMTMMVVSGRRYHHAELTNTYGALFTLHPKLKLRGGPGFRKELTADSDSPDPEEARVGSFRFLVEAGATLDPIALLAIGPLVTRLEGTFDYFLLEPTGATEHQIRASSRLSFPLLPTLFITAGLDVFAVNREGGGGWGAAYDTTVGIKVHFDGARQSM